MSDTMEDPLAGILPGTTAQVDPWASGAAGSAGIAVGTGTGQHGVTLMQSNGGDGTIAGAFSDVWNWINTPLTTPLAPSSIMLIVGIILISIIVWNLVLFHIRIAAEAI